MANGREGDKATRMIKILDGMWVKTIVFINPILFEILAAARNENAVKIPATEKIYDRVLKSALNFVKNQKETTLCITNPPAKESIAKSADSLVIIPLDGLDKVLVIGFDIFLLD